MAPIEYPPKRETQWGVDSSLMDAVLAELKAGLEVQVTYSPDNELAMAHEALHNTRHRIRKALAMLRKYDEGAGDE